MMQDEFIYEADREAEFIRSILKEWPADVELRLKAFKALDQLQLCARAWEGSR